MRAPRFGLLTLAVDPNPVARLFAAFAFTSFVLCNCGLELLGRASQRLAGAGNGGLLLRFE